MSEEEQKISNIKFDLNTGGMTQKQIASKYGMNVITINQINTGGLHKYILPLTDTQVYREEKRKQQIVKTQMEYILPISDQDDFDTVIKDINNKPGWPKVIILRADTEEDVKWLIGFLERRQNNLQIELSKIRLMMDAVERNDYSNLSDKLIKELNSKVSSIRQNEEPSLSRQEFIDKKES